MSLSRYSMTSARDCGPSAGGGISCRHYEYYLMRGNLHVIAAPSGAGKTSLVKALMEGDPALQFSVSYTTRAPRPTEIDGRDYHFVSAERFAEMVAAGEFLEHARVFDHSYGTALATAQSALAQGARLLLEIDWQGARQVRSKLPEA